MDFGDYLGKVASAIIALGISALAVRFIGRIIYPNIDFIEEIKKGNVAAAIFSGILLLFIAFVLGKIFRWIPR